MEKFTFFFRSGSPFSQWHPAEFKATPMFKNDSEVFTFQNAEQWMMYNKALLFKDEKCAKEVLEDPDPKTCKAIGRKIQNFNPKIWDEHKWNIVFEGNKHKFEQNKELYEVLVRTQGTTLVEASPFDKIWGIGLSASNPNSKSRATWKGQNLLGEILTKLRSELMEDKTKRG